MPVLNAGLIPAFSSRIFWINPSGAMHISDFLSYPLSQKYSNTGVPF